MAARKPKPTDLLTASDIAEMYGWPIGRAENVLKSIARQGNLVTIDGVRRMFIERRALEERITRG